ncbi:MAG: alpha/beta fold hydrolase [Deltaproteobacteria bacterium]|nr:alpha/beta fold hydrolase [Deltaproteobacteria bacterium]MBW2052187.1 alpha/beta fold hydrolase [Deltaproteobacteria bacterium]MBW2141390.1 alpha/beta fold hydrolase [Deltaproteobacteria bacterium]MBW2323540.1 alpha/beta fold hydrolase [Deltaproteobacteria bacterium]
MLYGHWDRYEPRPPEHEINSDILDFLLWAAEISEGLDPKIVNRLARSKQLPQLFSWPEGSVLRTPEERFANLPDYTYEPRYVEIEGLRMAYVEHGSGDPILMLHGEPTWGFLYRHMIPPLASSGRVIVPDLIGFGRSDKPIAVNAYTYKSHVRWMRAFIEALDLERITLVCQDWGGLIGIRTLAQEPQRFARLVAMNTGIPNGTGFTKAFMAWRRFSQKAREFDMPRFMRQAIQRTLTDEEAEAYGAPFPSKKYQTCALLFPRLVPIRPDHPGAYDNRAAIEKLKTLDLPVLLPSAEGDPVTRAFESVLRGIFKNAAPPLAVKKAGHFIQEDAGEEVAERIRKWMAETG